MCKLHIKAVALTICTMGEAFECCNIFVDTAFLHSEFLEIVCRMLVLGIVNECVVKIALQDLPGSHAEGNGCLPCLDLVEPLVRAVSPSFDFRSFDEREEVCTPLYQVARDRCSVIHEHEALELSEETEHSLAVPVESVGRRAF